MRRNFVNTCNASFWSGFVKSGDAFFMTLILMIVGCGALFPDPRPAPSPHDQTVVIDGNHSDCPGFTASRQQAADRAVAWAEICDQVKSGKITTVSQVAAYSLRKDLETSDRFNSTVQSWLESRLHGADGKLPEGSLSVFEELRDSFGRAAK